MGPPRPSSRPSSKEGAKDPTLQLSELLEWERKSRTEAQELLRDMEAELRAIKKSKAEGEAGRQNEEKLSEMLEWERARRTEETNKAVSEAMKHCDELDHERKRVAALESEQVEWDARSTSHSRHVAELQAEIAEGKEKNKLMGAAIRQLSVTTKALRKEMDVCRRETSTWLGMRQQVDEQMTRAVHPILPRVIARVDEHVSTAQAETAAAVAARLEAEAENARLARMLMEAQAVANEKEEVEREREAAAAEAKRWKADATKMQRVAERLRALGLLYI